MLRADEFRQGASLGKYEIIKKLAVGGMAQIYLARVRATAGFEKLVVLKRILPSVAEDASFVRMFLDEARLAATLRHPNIADVFDVGVEDNSYYFAMEFIHGQDARTLRLTAHELDREVPIEIALAIASGTAYALAYAHAKTGPNGPLGIVHRDITPSNIIVSYDGAVKLVDFGIARADSRTTGVKTRTGTLKGKVPYMSPEQCQGKPLDRRSDLFSLGSVLYELTTGQRPFDGHSEYDTLEMIVHGRARPPSTLVPAYPSELENIVMRLLANDPAARYQDADQVLVNLEKLTSDAGLLVSERAVAKYMREAFAEEIAEWDHAQIGATTQTESPAAEFVGNMATGSGELEPFSSPSPYDSTREYPRGRGRARPPTHLLPDDPPTVDPPTLEVEVEVATNEPLHALLVTPDVQVFVRSARSTSPPSPSPPSDGRPVRVASPTPSAATRAATLAAPSRTVSPSIARTQTRQPAPIKPPEARPADFGEEAPTTKATGEHLRDAVASRHVDADVTARDDSGRDDARAPRTQPDRTGLDGVLRFDPILARGDDLLDEVDRGAPRDEAPAVRALRRVKALCARCAASLASGDVEHAVVAAELALEEPAGDELVEGALHRERPTLLAAFESFLGDQARPVTLGRPLEELVDLKLDPSAGFLLSRIAGHATVEELLDMSGMPRFEAARHLCRLILRKMIIVG